MILFKKDNSVEAFQVDTNTPGFSTELNGLVVDIGSGTTIASIGMWVVNDGQKIYVVTDADKIALFHEGNRNILNQDEHNAYESRRRGHKLAVHIMKYMRTEGINPANRASVYGKLSNFLMLLMLGDLEVARVALNSVTTDAIFDSSRKSALLEKIDELIPN